MIDQFIIPDEVINSMYDAMYNFYQHVLVHKDVSHYGRLSFNKVILNDDLVRIAGSSNPFLVLLDGKVINENHLYRKGGLFSFDPNSDLFFELNKLEFEFDNLGKPTGYTQIPVILDREGKNMMECNQFDSRSIIKGSCLIVLNGNLINLITKENFGKLLNRIDAGDFLYVEIRDSKDLRTSRYRKVLKINKVTGNTELIYQSTNDS